MGHHRAKKAWSALLRPGPGVRHFPMPKPCGQEPLPKQGCSWECRKAAPRTGAMPALLWSQECGSTLQMSGVNSPCKEERQGCRREDFGEGLFLGSGGGVAAATLTCPTAPTGIKPPVPCPGAWTGGFIPQETPERMGHQLGEGQPAPRALSLFWRGARSGLGKAGSGRHPPLGAGPGMNILAKR